MTTALRTPPQKKPAGFSAFAALRRVIAAWTADDWAGGTWDDYCRREFAELRVTELAIDVRRLLVRAFRLAQMSEAAIASALAVSKSTVHADRVANGDTDEPTHVYSVDGSRRAASTGREEPEPERDLEVEQAMSNTDRTVHLTGLEGERGLTVLELRLLTDWHHGNASGTMSRVCRQQRVRRTDRSRLGYTVFVDPRFT